MIALYFRRDVFFSHLVSHLRAAGSGQRISETDGDFLCPYTVFLFVVRAGGVRARVTGGLAADGSTVGGEKHPWLDLVLKPKQTTAVEWSLKPGTGSRGKRISSHKHYEASLYVHRSCSFCFQYICQQHRQRPSYYMYHSTWSRGTHCYPSGECCIDGIP